MEIGYQQYGGLMGVTWHVDSGSTNSSGMEQAWELGTCNYITIPCITNQCLGDVN